MLPGRLHGVTFDRVMPILEPDSPLSRFSKWTSLHRHPYGAGIPSQRSSELFASIKEEKQIARRHHG